MQANMLTLTILMKLNPIIKLNFTYKKLIKEITSNNCSIYMNSII